MDLRAQVSLLKKPAMAQKTIACTMYTEDCRNTLFLPSWPCCVHSLETTSASCASSPVTQKWHKISPRGTVQVSICNKPASYPFRGDRSSGLNRCVRLQCQDSGAKTVIKYSKEAYRRLNKQLLFTYSSLERVFFKKIIVFFEKIAVD